MSARRKAVFLDIILDLPEELREQTLQQLAQFGESISSELQTGPEPVPAVPPSTAVKKPSKTDLNTLSHKWRELSESESKYLRRLRVMRDRYMPRLLKVHFASVSQYEVRKMFGNIGPLISAHEQLLACLTVDNTAESPWAERFLNLLKSPLHGLHQSYLSNYSEAQEILKKLSNEPRYRTLLAAVKAETSREYDDALGLGDLLSEPYQRLPKYRLLIEELEQHTHARDRNLPFFPKIVAQLARMVSFQAFETEKRAAVFSGLQKAVSGFDQELVSSNRVYIDSIDVEDWPMDQSTSEVKITAHRTGSPPQKCTLVLFNDMLVILKREPKLMARGRDYIGLSNMRQLLETTNASNLSKSSPTKKVLKQELAYRGSVPLELLSAADLGPEGFEIHMAAEPTGFSRNWTGRKRRHFTVMALPGGKVSLNQEKLRFADNLWRMQALSRIAPNGEVKKANMATVLQTAKMECKPEVACNLIFANLWDKESYLVEREAKLMNPLAVVVGDSSRIVFHASKGPHLVCSLARQQLSMRYRNSVKNVDQVNLVQAIARCALEGLSAGYFDTPPKLPYAITQEDFHKSVGHSRSRNHSVSVNRSGTVISTSTFDSRRSANSSRHERELSHVSSPPLSPVSSPLKQPITSPRVAESPSRLRQQARAYRSEPDEERTEVLWSPGASEHSGTRRLARTQSFEEVYHSMQAQSTIPQRPYSAMDYAYHPPDEDEGDQTVVASSPARSKSPLGPRSYSPAPSPTQQPRSPLGPRPLSSLASEANRPDPRPLPSPIPRPGSSCAPKRRLDTDSEEDAVRPKKPTLPSSLGSVRQSQLPKPRIPSGQRASGSRRTSADSSRRRVPPSVAVRAPEAEESSIVVHERPARKKYISGSFHSLHKLSTDNFDDADEDQAEELLDVRDETRSIGSIRRSPVFIDLPQMKEPRGTSPDDSTPGTSIQLASSASSQESAGLLESQRMEIDELREQNTQLMQQLSDADTRTQIAEKELEIARSKAEIAQMELGQANNHFGTLNQQLEAAGTEILTLREHNTQLKKEVDTANAASQVAFDCFNDELVELAEQMDNGDAGALSRALVAEKAAHHAAEQARRKKTASLAEVKRLLEQERYQRQTYEDLLVKHGLLRAS